MRHHTHSSSDISLLADYNLRSPNKSLSDGASFGVFLAVVAFLVLLYHVSPIVYRTVAPLWFVVLCLALCFYVAFRVWLRSLSFRLVRSALTLLGCFSVALFFVLGNYSLARRNEPVCYVVGEVVGWNSSSSAVVYVRSLMEVDVPPAEASNADASGILSMALYDGFFGFQFYDSVH